METLVSVERLPAAIANEVDRAVHAIAEEIPVDRRRLYARWHGADLWMIVQQDLHPEERVRLRQRPLDVRERPAHPYAASETVVLMLERRLTVGLYSDAPDALRFITDLVVHTPEGRYLSHNAEPDEAAPSESLLGLTRLLLAGDQNSSQIFSRVLSQLRQQWAAIQAADLASVSDWELLP